MATASSAQSSPRGRKSPPSLPVDQEHFLTSSSSAGEDFQLENGKKPVWNNQSNGEVASAVMGAESWPALSESARASPKSVKPAGSITISQVDLNGASPKQVNSSIPSPNSPSSRPKRSSGSFSPHMPATNDISPTPLAEHGSLVNTLTHNSTGKLLAGEPSRDNITTNKEGGHRGGSYSANETQPQRTYRRHNSGPLIRGDGSYHHGGRRDQERGGKQDWGHRSFNHRESHGSQQQTGSRPFLRGPAPNTPFVPPPTVAVRPFVAPVVYTEMQSPVFYVPGPHPDSLTPIPMVPMPSMFFSMHDPHLPTKIVNQIEYYFSNENLVKDTFLRQNMDGEGWVSIKLIASFKKVIQLTDNIHLILDVIKSSNAVEVQVDKVRRKGDWMKWIMTPTQTTEVSPQSVNRSGPNMLVAHLNSVTLGEEAAT
ncbi:la-related protein 1C-like [Salvia splendens]|uniref:la-related protein 1C-like n=1 Tax=Salvia splendens TaxID=180675 RepID=UPI00110535D9|nr:la-related protein 1C-like [Salvia splendens]